MEMKLADRVRCPMCGRPGEAFANQFGYAAVSCWRCEMAWLRYDNGTWAWVEWQDPVTFEIFPGGEMLVWDDRVEP